MKTKRSEFRAAAKEVLPFEAQQTRLYVNEVLAQRRASSRKAMWKLAGLVATAVALAYIAGKVI